jgi:hypothetical protein
LNEHYRSRNFSPHQKAFANQCIKALALIGLTQLIGMLDTTTFLYIAGAPIISDRLHHVGINENIAQALPALAAAFLQIVSDIKHIDKTLLTMLAGISGTLLGKMTLNSAHARLFGARQEALPNATASPAPAVIKH